MPVPPRSPNDGPAAATEGWGYTPAPNPSLPMELGAPGAALPAIEQGSLLVIRQFDLADEIDLDKVQTLRALPRSPLTRARATALLMSNPPLAVPLGTRQVALGGTPVELLVSARLFDFGAISIRMRVRLPSGTPWAVLSSLVRAAQVDEGLTRLGREVAEQLAKELHSALSGRHESNVYEDYVVAFVERFTQPVAPQTLPLDAIARLLLGETEEAQLSAAEIEEATRHRSSYYTDDLCVAGWSTALVVEPSGDTDPVDVLELANAQLLELRFYDALLDRELGRLYDEIGARRGKRIKVFRNYGPVLRRVMALLLEIAEFIERVENALKIIGDVYLARVYASAVDVLRITAWERAATRKQALVQQMYDVLKNEVDTSRGQIMEIIVIALIAGEILLAAHVTR